MRNGVRRSWGEPAFVLMTTCCAGPPSDARNDAVRTAAAHVDWSIFVALAKRHRVEGLVFDALARADLQPPAPMLQALAERAPEIARQSLIQAAESARLQGAFDAAGISNLLLKGAALEWLAYGGLGLKSAWDIDFLVSRDSALRARNVLETNGYSLIHPGELSLDAFSRWTKLSKEAVFSKNGRGGVVVELHWRLVDGDLLFDVSTASPSQSVNVAPGNALRTLANDEMIAYLMVHGASHGWSRLKWLADLNAILRHKNPEALEETYRRVTALGAGVCPALALRLCRRLFNLPLSAELGHALDAQFKARVLERFALHVMAGGGDRETAKRPFVDDAILASRLLFDHGWRWRRAEFRRQWVSIHDQTHLRLPAGLGFLYGVIRAPLWLWRRIKRL